jgi:hypothetical protein
VVDNEAGNAPKMIHRCFIAILFAAGATTLVRGAEPVDYVQQVKPLLAETCYKCHGASQQKGGLRMDTAALALKGGDTGPAFKPGKSADSLMIQAVLGTHPDISRMPYKKPPLTEPQIALLKNWVDQGAKAPGDEKPEVARHWAFIPPSRSPEPEVKQKGWVRNSIDAFVLARLEKEKLKPAPEAGRVTLIRRLSLDLLGLPPTPAEVEAFIRDAQSDAYEKLVERLLGSPHFGERWGRLWLDGARYADSNGYSIDAPRQIWMYRDWVIQALNKDMPFDQFTIWQIAGDMLPSATIEQKVATGFHRNTQINQEGGIDKEQFRIESVLDRVSTTGTVFLGLTVGCAQCHDHKFDPILQKEYYQLFAFLNNADEPDLPMGSPDMLNRQKDADAKVSAFIFGLAEKDPGVWDKMLAWERSLVPEERQKQSEAVRGTFDIAFEKRSAEQKQLVLAAFVEQAEENKAHQAQLRKIRAARPVVPSTMVMREREKPRESYLFIKGDFTRHGEVVQPGVPKSLHPLPSVENPNRLDLARWLVDTNNPLTARVTVNRLWQQYFGKGIVETDNDFGTQGIAPTHPELLDWLATEFMRKGWSLKEVHRLIVNSSTYRQSSRVRPELSLVDANNKYLGRQTRLRLDAEVVRDVALSASGLLSPKVGGPSVFPLQPDGVMSLGQVKREWKPSEGSDRYRRGLYTFFYRATPHPALSVFDSADGFSACTRRLRSNTPLQALTLLNDAAFYEFAQALAARVLKEAPAEDAARIEYAFKLCLGRSPAPAEKQRLAELLSQQKAAYSAGTSAEAPLVAAATAEKAADPRQFTAWTTVSRVLLNLDETITRE